MLFRWQERLIHCHAFSIPGRWRLLADPNFISLVCFLPFGSLSRLRHSLRLRIVLISLSSSSAELAAMNSNPHRSQSSVYDQQFLLEQCRWIRDDLDPQIARDGPDALHSDDVLTLDEFLRRLLTSNICLEDIRFSRLHLAIMSISGQATRWPSKLIERADTLKDAWETEHGSLKTLGTPLYETGGRLNGVCKLEDLSKDKLIIRWLKTPGIKLSPLVARRFGDLGFRPGECVRPYCLVPGYLILTA